MLHSDEHKVQRIAANLLSNAIKYSETGTIALSMTVMNEQWWVLEVMDNGCGIPPEDLDRIFSEFERLPCHADQPGLGLGLSIVKTLVQRLGGRLSLESTVGKGSHFRVELPRVLAG